MITFVIGGTRSGKSAFALRQASEVQGQKAYIATAQALDEEMRLRIEKHRQERRTDWHTVEEPLRLSEALAQLQPDYSCILLDCMTLWLSNIMAAGLAAEQEIDRFIEGLSSGQHRTQVFIVSNEVGLGIVPDNKIARQFRDLAGLLNQKIAEIADEVYLVAAGIPIKIKQGGNT